MCRTSKQMQANNEDETKRKKKELVVSTWNNNNKSKCLDKHHSRFIVCPFE